MVSTLSTQLAEAQSVTQEALALIFTSLCYLVHHNIVILSRQRKNFELVKLRTEDKPSLTKWLTKCKNWMNDTIRNEIHEMIAHDVQ